MAQDDDVFVLEQLAGLYLLFNGSTASGIGDVTAAPRASLEQNTPNPFNPTTVIRFRVSAAGPVQLKVYDVSGRLVRTLVDDVRGSQSAPYSVTWDGRDDNGSSAASGVYFYQLVVPGNIDTKKMVLLK
jgi:flagellar hook assembly protein FlgD